MSNNIEQDPMKKNYYHFVSVLSIFIFATFPSIQAISANKEWSSNNENPKVFIENKGQFHTYDPEQNVLYAFDNGSNMIYFTSNGVIYSFIEAKQKDKEEREEERERKKVFKTIEDWKKHEAAEKKVEYNMDAVNFTWENSNPEVEIIAQDLAQEYYSYTFKEKGAALKNVNFIKAYKKLLYKNLYPNIDVEYIFHPEKGIKYSLILHPGADISKVKMNYGKKVKLNKNGDLHISTLFGDIIEHAPTTFYLGGENIKSSFELKNNIISFKFNEPQTTNNQQRTIIIDPWVQTPTMSNSNCVWECEKDGAGNVYIIGGDAPLRLRKYNSAGTMQWTYNTPWDTATDWLGAMATDLAGNSYVTDGSTAALQKINTSGSMVYNVTGGSIDEYWNITFNCDQTKLIVGGTHGLPGIPPAIRGAIFDINPSSGAVTSTKIVGYSRTTTMFGLPVTDGEEVRSITSSRNAKYYFLTLDTIGCIDQDFSACPNGSIFNINDGYSFSYKCENYRPSNGNAGMCSIRANRYFVYSQNGTTIQKRSLTTGAIITSAAIAGGISISSGSLNQAGNSGIDIDSCGNVYVGSGNAVIKYDANLSVISSVTLPFRVYDVAVSYSGNVIVAGATGNSSNASRVGYVQSINMSSCDPMILFCCDATVCPVGPYCTNQAPVTLTPVTPGGTWSGVGVNSSGVFNPATAGVGLHTIIYTLPCGSDSIRIKVNCCGSAINPAGPFCLSTAPVTLTAALSGGTWSGPGVNASTGVFTPSVAGIGTHNIIYSIAGCGNDTLSIVVSGCVALIACKETNGNITVSAGAGPYTWYTQTTTQNCTACFFGCTIPPGCAVNVITWTSFATGTTVTPTTFPILIIDSAGDSIQISSLASLQLCSNTCPPLTVTAVNIVNDSCFGQSNGSFSASTTGGTSPWDYVLKLGTTTIATFNNIAGTQSFTGLAAGTYTLNVLDSNNCPGTTTIIITQPAAGSIATAGPDQTMCGNSTVLAGNAPTVGTGIWTLISGTGTITTPASATSAVTGLGVGTAVFLWTISNSPCPSSSDSVAITNTGGGPTVTITAQTNVSCYGGNNGSATASASGGSGNLTYLWTVNGGSLPIATNMVAGTYTITVTDASSCTSVATVTIAQADSISAQVTTTPAGCTNTGSATVNANGGTGLLTYLWVPGNATTPTITNLSAGPYTVTITDSASCTKSVSTTVGSAGGITANAGVNVTIAPGSSTQLAASGGSTYLWSPPTGLDCDSCRTPIASPAETTTYCVMVSDSGCFDTACVTVRVEIPFVECGTVYVPNAFTPGNSDLLNDKFKPIAGCVHDYSFMIFNRWGEKIFETTDTSEGWNGYYKNKLSKQDVYVYKISFIDDTKNDFHQYIGTVTLIK